jgi:hypothetical protein
MEQWLINTAGPGGIVIVGVVLVLREVRRLQPDILGKLDRIDGQIGELRSELETVSSRLDQHIDESRVKNGRRSNLGSIGIK